MRCKTSMLRLNLCDYSGVYIVVKGRIYVRATTNTNIDWFDNALDGKPFKYKTTIIGKTGG